jgi:hypothetical protein
VPIAFSGDTLVLRAFEQASSSYLVYVFTQAGDTWTEQARLTALDIPEAARPGSSVAFSDDTILWSEAIDDAAEVDSSAAFSNSAYVFTRNGGNWNYQARLTPAETPECASLSQPDGARLALDGETAVLQTVCSPEPGVMDGGTRVIEITIFTRNEDTWTEQTTLTASDGSTALSPGSIAISDNTVVLGKERAEGDSAYIFDLSNTSHTQPDTNPDPDNPQIDQGSSDSGGGAFGLLMIWLAGFVWTKRLQPFISSA